ncbi:SAM-dependent methyltransferase [Catenovulum agarivorans DS-2]|uniref:SAM-dependent methyltransferase n=1 Tax=Catenovulum agarivorans DS-2 TaxID=1328313 RepID=W7QSZ2_9ALTE|nr:class I SAM-dependent methyltransferase [Catenovulum agarivorans]EWH11013.1 SAM-dependent methyltransferase [Catenovulum agarivorans DS-2]
MADTYKITLASKREKSVLRRHPWVFSRAIAQVDGTPKVGDTVEVYAKNGQWLARAAYSPHSQIRARIWTFDQDESIDQAFFAKRINRAYQAKQQVVTNSNAYRLIAGESDGLPGLTIDLYNNILVCQFLAAGVEKHKTDIVAALEQIFSDLAIYERSDVDVRQKEGLKPTSGWLKPGPNTSTWINEAGNQILVDVEQGHKTGFYLDQRDNRLIAAEYCKGQQVLNCFSYTGTFGLHALTAGAKHVTNLDVSQLALDTSAKIYQHNQLNEKQYTHLNADVFKQLRQYKQQGKEFDCIILDPPKFAENKGQVIRACRGYKDINMLALQILRPGGVLLTFSCSGLIGADLFQKVVADAALDAKVEAHIIEKLTQAKDHSVLLNYPEGFYLKGLVVQKR